MTMGLIYPLDNSYTNKFYETPNSHKNIETTALGIFKGVTKWAFVPP